MNSLKSVQKSILKSHFLRISTNFLRNTSDLGIIDPEPNQQVTIPKPKERPGETVDQRKSRLMYQSRKRGMLENDLLLSTFASKHLKGFSEVQLAEYDLLINGPSNDWDLFYWATENKPTPDEYGDLEVMKMLKLHCKNLNREKRLRQPDLS